VTDLPLFRQAHLLSGPDAQDTAGDTAPSACKVIARHDPIGRIALAHKHSCQLVRFAAPRPLMRRALERATHQHRPTTTITDRVARHGVALSRGKVAKMWGTEEMLAKPHTHSLPCTLHSQTHRLLLPPKVPSQRATITASASRASLSIAHRDQQWSSPGAIGLVPIYSPLTITDMARIYPAVPFARSMPESLNSEDCCGQARQPP
jgi:hypothetical protein